MSAELIRRNTQASSSRLEYLFNLLQDGNNDIGTLQEDDISTPQGQEDDNNEYERPNATDYFILPCVAVSKYLSTYYILYIGSYFKVGVLLIL